MGASAPGGIDTGNPLAIVAARVVIGVMQNERLPERADLAQQRR